MLFAAGYLLFSTLTTVGLLAIWAARSRWHWFWRLMIFLGVAALPVLIPAYELFVAFAVQGAVVAAGVQAARWAKRRQERRLRGEPRPVPQFSLRDALLVVVPVACLSAIGVRLPALDAPTWLSIVGAGAIAGVATLLALWMVRGTRPAWWARLLIAAPLGLALASPLAIWDKTLGSAIYQLGWPPVDPGISWFGQEGTERIVWLAVMLGVVLGAVLVMWCLAPWVRREPGRSRWRRLLTAPLLFVLGVLVLTPPLGVFYQLMNPLPIPEHKVPNPNGYDDFLAATKLLPANPIVNGGNFDSTTAPLAQLQAASKELRPAFDQVHLGLPKLVWKLQDYTSDDLLLGSIHEFRIIARGYDAAGRAAAQAGDTSEAAGLYLDAIRFGVGITRGGLMVDALVGNACCGIGCRGLFEVRDQVRVADFPRVITGLEDAEGQLEAFEAIILRDRIWTQQVYGWHGHLYQILEQVADDENSSEPSLLSAYQRHQAQLRLLKLEFALRLWKTEHSEWPESLEQLAPAILPAVPLDPYDPAGKPLRYQRTDEGFLLYSVGQNGVDDGGKPAEYDPVNFWRDPAFGDLRLDILYAPDPVEEPEADDEEWIGEPEEEGFNDAMSPET